MSQRNKILEHMRLFGSITQAEAISRFHCYRLGARIFELKKQGVPIKKETVVRRRADGTYYSFAKYSIAEEAD